jgi:PPPDE putative peptidase domain
MPSTNIVLNVYDVSTPQDPALIPSINSWIGVGGLGVFHSGVEIGGVEYCFGGHEDSSTGVFQIEPRTAPDARFRQAIHIGECSLDWRGLRRVLDSYSDGWSGNSYNLLTRNCNHYSDALCFELTGARIPGWVNRLAFIGSKFSAFLPAEFLNPGAAPVTAAAASGTNVAVRASSRPPLTIEERRAAAEKAAIAAEVRAAAAAANVDFDDPDHDFEFQASNVRYQEFR